jgi:NAD-reducing hydrogenase large subunit
MHHGQLLQSHALHFFHLSSPDLLFGFASDVAQRHIVGVAQRYPDIAKKGILLRKFGQEVIRHTSGKRVHGTAAVPGGVNKSLSKDERAALQQDIAQTVQWSREAVQIIQEMHQRSPQLYEQFGSFRSNFMSLVASDGAMDLYDGQLRVKNADGELLFDALDYRQYDDFITEAVKPWTYMKFPYLNALGPDEGWYRVGPLARVQTCDRIPTPLAEQERQVWLAYAARQAGGGLMHASLAYHWARMIEMLHAAETIDALLQDDDIQGQDLRVTGPRQHRGVGVIEAPRGTLIHHYEVGDDDLVTMANLIVSTTHNNHAMNTAVRDVARRYLNGHEITEGLLNHIEVAIRAYDPCLSCATHAIGQMPLEVTLLNAQGEVIAQAHKHSGQ